MMKRMISALLILAMISASTFAIAEENGGLWGQIGDFLGLFDRFGDGHFQIFGDHFGKFVALFK